MLTVLLQDAMLRTMPIPTPTTARVIPFDTAGDWKTRLAALAEPITGPLMIHCALPVALWIQRAGSPRLQTALSLPPLLASEQLVRLGPLLLNNTALFCPFGHLDAHWDHFDTLWGPDLFLRPNSAFKPFAGRPMPKANRALEMASLRQIERVAAAELCMVAPMQSFSLPEWRFWMVEGDIAACAPYAFDTPVAPQACPPALADLAQTAARQCEDLDPLLVVDCVFDAHNTPKVMELNAFSTSGFYPGVDFENLWEKTYCLYC